jgi:perosamine synthetase
LNAFSFAVGIARFGRNQARNLGQVVRGHPLVTPPLGSVTLGPDDVAIAKELLKSREGWFDSAVIERYEKAFRLWNGSEHAFAFMGGRVALSACIHALNLKPGDEVVIPGYTCVAVPNAFKYAGVKVRYGLVCRDYEKIVNLARDRNLFVIEDCAQSAGAEIKGRKVGNLGDVAIYSTEQSKVFTTIEGGLATCNDPVLAKRFIDYKMSASYPGTVRIENELYSVIVNYYTNVAASRWWKGDLVRFIHRKRIVISTTKEEERGIMPAYYGCKMPAALALLGLNQLAKVDRHNQGRREAARYWDNWCDENGYTKPCVIDDSQPVFLRYPVLVEPDKKFDTTWAYRELGVMLGVWFKSNVHPAGWKVEGCPNADEAVRRCVNFPTGKRLR